MSDDLVKRLREAVNGEHDMTPHGADCLLAADRIEEIDSAFANLQRHCQRQRDNIEALEKEWTYWRDECQKFRDAWVNEKTRLTEMGLPNTTKEL